MIRTPPQHNTVNPPGQIRNPPHMEVPLGRAIDAFRDEEMAGLRGRVAQLEKELKYVRGENLRLYAEVENGKKNFSNF